MTASDGDAIGNQRASALARAGNGALGVAFPVALWAITTLMAIGRTTWWADDRFHNLRDPASGALPALRLYPRWPFWSWGVDLGYFIRPLYYEIMPALTTLFWNNSWMAQALQAIVHAVVCFLLFRVMVGLRLNRAIAAIGALLFMVHPAHSEASAWFAALPTQLSCAIVLWIVLRHIVWSREDHRADNDGEAETNARGTSGARGHLLLLPISGFVACCLNEQAASGFALLPLVYLAAGPRETAGRSRAKGALGPMVLACAGVGLYLAILTWSAPAGHRGSGGTLAGISAIGTRFDGFLTVLWRRMILKNFAIGAESYAISSMGWTRAQGAWFVWLPLTLLGCSWTIRTIVRSGMRAQENAAARARHWTIALLGIAGFVVGWLPVLLAAGYEPDSRLRYWPDVWLTIALAAFVSIVLRAGARMLPRRVSLVLFFGAVIAAAAGSGVLVRFAAMNAGARLAMSDRFALDRAQGEQLRALLPDPPRGTLIVPLRIETTGIETGSPVFDAYFKSAMEFPWTAPKWLVSVYGRGDVEAGFWRKWTTPIADGAARRAGDPVRGAREEGLVYAAEVGPRSPRGGSATRIVAWDRVAAFVIGKDARVRLVTAIVIVDEDGAEMTIELPQAKGREECVARLPRR